MIIIITTTATTIMIIINNNNNDDNDDGDDDDNNNNNNSNNTIIALKGANRNFCNVFTAPRTVSNTYAQVAKAKSCENHVQHIESLSRATCVHVVRRDSSGIKFDRV